MIRTNEVIFLTEYQSIDDVKYCSSEIFRQKYFIDNKIQGKIFLWIHDFLKIFYLEHISLEIIHDCSRYHSEVINLDKNH